MLANLRRNVRIYVRLQLLHGRVSLEYPSSFAVGGGAIVLGELATFAFIWTVFTRAPEVGGWSAWEALFLYALVMIPSALSGFVAGGFWSIPHYVNSGRLDQILVRPISPALQMATLYVDMRNIGRLLLGIACLLLATNELHFAWHTWQVAFLIGTLISSLLLFNAIFFMPLCLAFWTLGDTTALHAWLYNFVEFAKFPTHLYGPLVQFVLTWIIPFAFVSYYPAAVLLGKPLAHPWLGYFSLLAGPVAALLAAIVWQQGLRRYQSSGH